MIRRLGIACLVLLAVPATAGARWGTTGTGPGSANATTLNAAVLSTPATSTGSPTVTWTSQAGVAGAAGAGPITYVVQRRLGSSGGFTDVATGPCSGALTKPATTCTDTTLAANGTYQYRTVATLASWTATSDPVSVVVNHPPPTVTSIVRNDASPTSANSVTWTVKFSESVTGVNAGDFSFTKTVTGAPAVTGVTGSGDTYVVTATTGSGDGTVRLDVTDDDTVKDSFSLPLGGTGAGNGSFTSGEVYTFDRTAPVVQTVQFFDVNADGKVDQVKATFDEALAASTATAPWTLANVPSAGTLASVSTSGTVATLTLNQGAGAANTAVGTFTVALAPSATGIRDTLGNQSSFATRTPTDKAGPILMSVTFGGGGTAGKIESAFLLTPADFVTFGFSENVIGVPATTTISETRPASGNATLTIPSVLPTTNLGAANYLTGAGTIGFAAATTVTGANVTVTVGACDGLLGLNCLVASAGTAASITFIPATTITDAPGNAAGGAVTSTTRAF